MTIHAIANNIILKMIAKFVNHVTIPALLVRQQLHASLVMILMITGNQALMVYVSVKMDIITMAPIGSA